MSDNGVWIWIVTGFHRSWEATSVVIKPKTASNRGADACCATLPTRARLRHHRAPMGSNCDGVDYESLATVLIVATAAFTKLNYN